MVNEAIAMEPPQNHLFVSLYSPNAEILTTGGCYGKGSCACSCACSEGQESIIQHIHSWWFFK